MSNEASIFKVVNLSTPVECQTGRVVWRALAQTSQLSVTLFAFPAGEGSSAPPASGDAPGGGAAGEALIPPDAAAMSGSAGRSRVWPANIPPAAAAPERFKMLRMRDKSEPA